MNLKQKIKDLVAENRNDEVRLIIRTVTKNKQQGAEQFCDYAFS